MLEGSSSLPIFLFLQWPTLYEVEIPDDDVEMVASSAGVSKEDAKAALEESKGDLAEAIMKLSQ